MSQDRAPNNSNINSTIAKHDDASTNEKGPVDGGDDEQKLTYPLPNDDSAAATSVNQPPSSAFKPTNAQHVSRRSTSINDASSSSSVAVTSFTSNDSISPAPRHPQPSSSSSSSPAHNRRRADSSTTRIPADTDTDPSRPTAGAISIPSIRRSQSVTMGYSASPNSHHAHLNAPFGSPPVLSSTPPMNGPTLSSTPNSSSMHANNKRRTMIQQFIRSGESNMSFREKAPSIVQNETGVFYAPPPAAGGATSIMIDSRSSSPLNGLNRHRRANSAFGPPGNVYPNPLLDQPSRSNSRNGPDDDGAAPSPSAMPRRFSLFSRGSSASPVRSSGSSRRRAPSPTLTQGLLARSSSLSPSHHTPRQRRTRRNGSGHGPTTVEAEESRRRQEEREAKMLAPFLEARGNEDFVTYDLTRQQDYHKQRKELIRARFHRWTKGHLKKRRSDLELEDDAGQGVSGTVPYKDSSVHPNPDDDDHIPKAADPDDEPSDESESDWDDSLDDSTLSAEHGLNASLTRRRAGYCSRRRWRARWRLLKQRLGRNIIATTFVKACMLGQSWIICGIIGALTGLVASLVDLAVQWLIDLKSGYCSDALWLSNSVCCAGSKQYVGIPSSQPLLLSCPEWVNWDANSSIASSVGTALSPFLAGYMMYILLGLGMACISAWLVIYFAPHASGSGIPEIKTILGGVVVKKYLGAWTLLIKCIALSLSVGSGLSIGKEGPFVHISCCIANIVCRFFPESKNNQYKKNEALSAAAAAGISVAFGAPVGGVLFSLEDVCSYFPHKTMWRAFFCAIIASLVLQSIDPYQEGRLVLFQIGYSKNWYYFEMVPFALLGVLGGLLGALFIKLNTKVTQFRRNSFVKQYPMLEVAVVILITTLIRFLSSYLRGNNNATLAALFGDCDPDGALYDPLKMCDYSTTNETIASLLFVSFITFVFTMFSWSLCVPGGVFIPTLIIGAALGRVVGTGMREWQRSPYAMSLFEGCDEFTPGIYALVGAASMLGGVTRMTVCLVVIMFELTGGLMYLLPIMVGVMFSKLVGDVFDRRSIFEAHLALNKYPFLNSKDKISPKIRVSDAMTRDLLVLPMHGHTVESLTDQLALLGELTITGFPIVTTLKDRLIVGYINRSELYTALCLALRNPSITPQTRCYFAMLSLRFPRNEPYVDLRPWLHPSPIQVVEHTPLYRVHDMFKKLGLRYCLVTNFGKLVGILTKKDLLNFTEGQTSREPIDSASNQQQMRQYSTVQ